MKDDGFVEYVKDILEPLCSITTRTMFGGHGIYRAGKMIAIIISSELYFKANSKSAEYFKSYGSEPFRYQGKGKLITMSYWKAPPEVMDDQEILKKWVDLASEAALQPPKKQNRDSQK